MMLISFYLLCFFCSDDADDDDQLSPGASPTQPGHNSAQYLERGHLPLVGGVGDLVNRKHIFSKRSNDILITIIN